ncbi:SDR family oxidoreductase [Streptomyces somaliensis DSM 40738]|uniref:SDR family oxidoreductase n=1 Tax=Streptomyces somaliensis (strain ATCC 33201 / DSM 40738 / JCM 12659 / KCTC 9044 / NCTC 11332 / NRRL B-12077 / IP 733) TaxID=1134445 RepID=A0AA44DCA2_STRE0|nr:SDR family oxidoreductase [Streptomyces somaliensis]MCQ0023976.1 SDR family oxidoreductase [Streptomyces somaliensis DSM 40738]NKY14233.1 SDR family oxidoreductase [Streptomyces somaliensis DSM 40738]
MRAALVTGGSRGIGRAVVERLAGDGATVVFGYVSDERAAREVEEACGGRAVAVRADLARPDGVERLFATADAVFADRGAGRLWALVNNAGVIDHTPVGEFAPDVFDRVMAVNARAPFLAVREAARRMGEGGRIVTVSSTGTAWPSAGEAVYAASKAAVEQLTRVASRELGRCGITVNAVSPGPTDTDMLRTGAPPEAVAGAAHMTALGRVGTPADIAAVVALLLGPDAAWLTGQNLVADGGLV